jgi:hypothetical protein
LQDLLGCRIYLAAYFPARRARCFVPIRISCEIKDIKDEIVVMIMQREVGGSVYKTIELVGSSPIGWEEAVKGAVDMASDRLTNLRIAEVVELDAKLADGRIVEYRAKVRVSFKHEIEPETL